MKGLRMDGMSNVCKVSSSETRIKTISVSKEFHPPTQSHSWFRSGFKNLSMHPLIPCSLSFISLRLTIPIVREVAKRMRDTYLIIREDPYEQTNKIFARR